MTDINITLILMAAVNTDIPQFYTNTCVFGSLTRIQSDTSGAIQCTSSSAD